MSLKNMSETNPETSRRSSLGGLLRATREGRNISLDAASTFTRISVRILTALESNDFATLPAEVFTRGFIKIYAEYLGLDPSEVLKLFTDQENLDPERPADRPYRRDILFGTAMAHPLQLFKGNPRLRIIAILVAALLSFYALGAVFKSLQRHPGQDSPENELGKSLVNGQAPTLPGPPGVELPPVNANAPSGLAGNSTVPASQTGTPPLSGPESLTSRNSPEAAAPTGVSAPTVIRYPRANAAVSNNARPAPGELAPPAGVSSPTTTDQSQTTASAAPQR